MTDTERLVRMLERIRSDAADLRGYATAGPALAGDRTALRAVKYTFITAIEGVSRACQHIVVSQGWPVADTSADAVRELARHTVVDVELSEALARAIGFRNLLVHQYADVDDARVVANLVHVGDFDSFAEQVATWLGRPCAAG